MRRVCSGTPLSRPAFTLAELLLALAIMSIIGMAVVLVLGAMGNATAEQHDIRRAAVARQVASVRFGAMLRSSCMVLGLSQDRIVLWKGDETGNGAPDLSEIRAIRWDNTSGEIRTSDAPSGLDPALNTSYELTEDFVGVAALLQDSAVFPERTTLMRVQEWSIGLDTSIVHEATLIRARLIMTGRGDKEVEAIVVASCRGSH